MENQYLSEGSADEEWVEIEFPSKDSKPSNSTTNPDDSVTISTEKDGFFIDSEEVVSSTNQNPINDTNVEIEEEEGTVQEEERKSVIVLGFDRLKYRIVAVFSRMRKNCVISSKGRIFTTGFGAVFCVSVFLVYLRVQWRRRQAKLLEKRLEIKEKDQVIKESWIYGTLSFFYVLQWKIS